MSLNGVEFTGYWNAETNRVEGKVNVRLFDTPRQGLQLYKVSKGGTTQLGNITEWFEGDFAYYNGFEWSRFGNGNPNTLTALMRRAAKEAARRTFPGDGAPMSDDAQALLGVSYPLIELGYIGDSRPHPLREVKRCQGINTKGWSVDDWKTLFPRVYSLDQELDGVVLQRYWDQRLWGGRCYLPDGFGRSSDETITGGLQSIAYVGAQRDTCGIIYLNSLSSGGNGFGISHGRTGKTEGTFMASNMSILCSGGKFATALTVRFNGEQFNKPNCYLLNNVLIKGLNQDFASSPAVPDYWANPTVTYDIVRGLAWYDVISIKPNPEIDATDHHTFIVDYVNRASNSYNFYNCINYGGAYVYAFNYDGVAVTQTHEESIFWNCQGYDCIGLCRNDAINLGAPYADNWIFYECQCANRGGPIFKFSRTELVSIYGGLYGNNIPMNGLQSYFGRFTNCSVVRIINPHSINAGFNGAPQNFYHLYFEGPGCKEIMVENYTATNYGNFGAVVGIAADVPPRAYKDRGIQFNLGGPEPTIAWVDDQSNGQLSQLRVRKAFEKGQRDGYITGAGSIEIDDECTFTLRDVFTSNLDANGDSFYNLLPGMFRRPPIAQPWNANIAQNVGNVQPGLLPHSAAESIAQVKFRYPGGGGKTATTAVAITVSGG